MKELIKALADLDRCRKEKNGMMLERDRAQADLRESQRKVRQLEQMLAESKSFHPGEPQER